MIICIALYSVLVIIDCTLCMNISYLIDIYASNCGAMLCNPITFSTLPVVGFSNDEFCPTCSCSDSCLWTRNCCPDKFFDWKLTCVDTTIMKYSFHELGEQQSFSMVTKCPEHADEETKQNCEHVHLENKDGNLTNVPVYSFTSGMTYRNIYCSECHNETIEKILPWQIDVQCQKFADFNFLSSYDAIVQQAKQSMCKFSYAVPKHMFHQGKCWNNVCKGRARCDFGESLIDECNVTGTWEALDEDVDLACRIYDNKYNNTYKNMFCHICNSPKTKYSNKTGYGETNNMYNENNTILYRTNLTFSNYKQKEFNATSNCNSTQLFFQNKCLDIMCYPGKMIADSGCKPLLQFTEKLGYVMYANIKITPGSDMNITTVRFILLIDAKFKEHVVRNMTLSSLEYPFDSTYLITDQNCKQDVKEGNEITISVYYQLFFEFNVNRTNVEEALVQSISSNFNITFENVTHFVQVKPNSSALNTPKIIGKSKNKQNTHNCYIIKKKSKNKYRVKRNKYIFSNVSDLLLCEQVELHPNDFEIDKSTLALKIVDSRIELSSEKYLLKIPQKARLCVKYLPLNTIYPSTTTSLTITIWIIPIRICISLSLICLLISFVTYCLFKTLRTLPGKNNMCLVFAMFCSNVIVLSQTFQWQGISCRAVGILNHYFFLAQFACLGVCSFHMYRVFSNPTGARLSERTHLICYIVISFCTPALIVLLNVIITTATSDNKNADCFLPERMAFMFSFIVPIGLICCLNIYFFISTSLIIARRPKLKNASKTRRNRVHFLVYLRLFAITGITWLLQIIGAFVPYSAFSLTIFIFNALQGFFIFLSYICNQRILNLYRNLCESFREASISLNISCKTISTEISRSESMVSKMDTRL